MNNLVEIKNNQVVVSSRDVAENFGKQHKNVLRAIDDLVAQNSATQNMFNEQVREYHGQDFRYYYMNRDGFSLLVMGFTGAEAIEWKLKYIEAFNSMEKKLKNPLALPNFSNPAEAARAWADEFEKRKQAEQLIEAQKPKVIFAEAVSASKTSILVGELAKILRGNGIPIGQRRFFQWLRENGYLIKRKGTDYNMPTQRSMELGLFEIKEGFYVNGDGVNVITKTPKITGKGQNYFINKFLKEGA